MDARKLVQAITSGPAHAWPTDPRQWASIVAATALGFYLLATAQEELAVMIWIWALNQVGIGGQTAAAVGGARVAAEHAQRAATSAEFGAAEMERLRAQLRDPVTPPPPGADQCRS